MKKTITELFFYTVFTVFLTFGLTVSFQSFLNAWTEPSEAPPEGFVAVAGADNFGNHIATDNIDMEGHYLSGDGDSEGLSVDFDGNAFFSHTLSISGNVGIGLTNPTNKLTVTGARSTISRANAIAKIGGDDVYTYFGTINSDPWSSWIQVMNDINTSLPLSLNPSGGNVGVGKTNPTASLDIYSASDGFSGLNGIKLSGTGWQTLAMDGDASTKTFALHYGDNTDNTVRFGRYENNFGNWEANVAYLDLDNGNFQIDGNFKMGNYYFDGDGVGSGDDGWLRLLDSDNGSFKHLGVESLWVNNTLYVDKICNKATDVCSDVSAGVGGGLNVSSEFQASLTIACGTSICTNKVYMGTDWDFCSLTLVSFRDSTYTHDDATCMVGEDGGGWYVTAYSFNSSAKVVHCWARCLGAN